MSGFAVSPEARSDLNEILAYREENFGLDAALALEDELLEAFQRLALTPGLGHRRSDLTSRPVYFYALSPYLIIYARHVDPLPIVAVLHSARNVRKLLSSRFRR